MKPAPILFVDDSAVARFAVRQRFVEQELEVVVLGSAAEAASVAGSGFAAALLDIELGDGFGTDLAARLRADAPALPIAFLTAGGPAPKLDEAAHLGPVFSKASELEAAVSWIAEAVRRI